MKKGNLIYWEISDFLVTKEELERLGYGGFLPKNELSTAMIKAMKIVTKGKDKFYRRKGEKFAVLQQYESSADVDVQKEIGFALDEKTGTIEWNGQPSVAIEEAFKASQKTIDSNQLRDMVLKMVKAYGVSMRKAGGIYFVDEQFNDKLEELKKLFNAFPMNTRLYEIPIYNDSATLDAIEEATSSEILKEIDKLIDDVNERFEEKAITTGQLKGKQKQAIEILAKVKLHEENLRSRHAVLAEKVAKTTVALELVWSRVDEAIYDPEDFILALQKA